MDNVLGPNVNGHKLPLETYYSTNEYLATTTLCRKKKKHYQYAKGILPIRALRFFVKVLQ